MAEKRVYGPAQVATGPTTVYTVPSVAGSEQRLTIRLIHVVNTTGTAATFTLSVGTDGVATRLYDAYSVAGGGILDWYGELTLEAGELVQVASGTNNALTLIINGDLDTR